MSVEDRKGFFVDKLLEWYSENGRSFPWRGENREPYEILIAEIMLKRTTSTHVERVYEDFLGEYPSPEGLADAEVAMLERILEPLGLQRQRSRIFKGLGRQLVTDFSGKVPESRGSLLELEGVGEYAADSVRCFAFDIQTPIIDSNVRRVMDRFFELKDDNELREFLEDIIPKEHYKEFNYALLDYGALVSRPQHPTCGETELSKICLHCHS